MVKLQPASEQFMRCVCSSSFIFLNPWIVHCRIFGAKKLGPGDASNMKST